MKYVTKEQQAAKPLLTDDAGKYKEKWKFFSLFPVITFFLLSVVLCAGLIYCAFYIIELRILATRPIIVQREGHEFKLFNGGIDRKLDYIEFDESPRKQEKSTSCYQVSSRFDCLSIADPSEQKCLARGCCWKAPDDTITGNGSERADKLGHLGVPTCFYPLGFSKYRLTSYNHMDYGFIGMLERDKDAINVYPNPVQRLELKITFETKDGVRLEFSDHDQARFRVPYPKLPDSPKRRPDELDYQVKLTRDPFSLKIERKHGGEAIFDTSAGLFDFYDQFIEISSLLPSNFIYGLGEHSDRLLHPVDYTRFTFFATDGSPSPNNALYGSHPFYLSMEEDGRSHGVLMLNSNGMDVVLSPAPAITYRTIGGILDFHAFLGPSPKDVVAQYINLIGKPALPPYWALGFHLCKYGYGSLNRTQEVMQRNIAAGIPLDVQWNDIDYMDKYRDVTEDEKTYDGLAGFVHSLHERGMHYMVITDPGISGVEEAGSYDPFDDGVAMNVFVKNASGQILRGKVWTGEDTVFPDFTHPNATDYWTKQVVDFHQLIGFDGLWIDMNEPSNFVSGSLSGCPNSSLESPPYLPHIPHATLKDSTLCMTAQQYAGNHYDVHNLYGLTEAMVTQRALLTARRGRRPLIISRSTFIGQGRYSGHWSGDITSTWDSLQRTIPNILNFNMFGVPLTGADICGFIYDTNEQLCLRWQQVGAFYPFARNHNDFGQKDQDPAVWSQPVIDAIKRSLEIRYQLLPVFYSLFFRAAFTGATVVRPLFFEFPQDKQAYAVDWQFLLGEALMVSPVLTENTTDIMAYFPEARWYDFYTGSELKTTGQPWQNLSAPLDKINLHIRGGAILPSQAPNTTTTVTRRNAFKLTITLDNRREARGELFWDDGEEFDVIAAQHYTHITFHVARRGVLESRVEKANYTDIPKLDEIAVLGFDGSPRSVLVNGNATQFQYDTDERVLTITALALDLLVPFKIIFVF